MACIHYIGQKVKNICLAIFISNTVIPTSSSISVSSYMCFTFIFKSQVLPQTYCVAKDGFELVIFVPLHPECWNYRCVPALPIYALCMLGKLSAVSQHLTSLRVYLLFSYTVVLWKNEEDGVHEGTSPGPHLSWHLVCTSQTGSHGDTLANF